MARYDYGRQFRGRDPAAPWYPGGFWAGAPMYGWGAMGEAGMWGWPTYFPVGYGSDPRSFAPRRRRPQESPTYGRGGDEAARRYAQSHGYDAGYSIPPHFDRQWRPRPRYDRGYRGGR